MLSKQCLQCTGMHVPPTFRDSTVPIDAIFATAGIKCANAYILPHKGEVCEHWCFILDFMSSSDIGLKFPNIVRCSARKLHCKSKRLAQSYNAELDMLCNHHNMYQIIYCIYSNIYSFSDEEFLYLMNNWDKELVRSKLHLGVNCTKIQDVPHQVERRGGFLVITALATSVHQDICHGTWSSQSL